MMKLLKMPEEKLREILPPPEAVEQLLQFKQQLQSEAESSTEET